MGSVTTGDPAVFRRIARFLKGMVVISLAAIWLIFGGIAYNSYQNDWATASLVANNVAILLEREIARNIEVYDLSLKAVVRGMADPRTATLPNDLRRAVLFDRSAAAPGLGSILVVDRTGHVILDSRSEAKTDTDLQDRDYFQVHRDGAFGNGLFVSRPFLSRRTQIWSIGLSRRVADPDGSFGGIVVGAVRLEYISSLFSGLRLPPDSAVFLADASGASIARTPFDTSDIGKPTALARAFKRPRGGSGEFTEVSTYDGVRRLLVYRSIDAWPLFQGVGLSADRLLVIWLQREAVLAAAFFGLSLLIVVLGFTLDKEFRRRFQAEQALSDLATTDGLTGLINRRRFNELLALEWRRSARAEGPLSLLMIDCDFFKGFNDAFGHLEGDTTLRAVADTIGATVCRPADVAARFGGEEFVVLLPSTGLEGAQFVAESIRTRVMDLRIPHPKSPFGLVTVSVGVASLRPTKEQDAASLVHAADVALYDVKAKGRNAVVMASPPIIPDGHDTRIPI